MNLAVPNDFPPRRRATISSAGDATRTSAVRSSRRFPEKPSNGLEPLTPSLPWKKHDTTDCDRIYPIGSTKPFLAFF